MRVFGTILILLLAGCTASNGPGGQSLEAGGDGGGTLSYNGGAGGSDDKEIQCGAKGKVTVNSNTGGSVKFKVTDGGGKTIYSKSGSTGQMTDSKAIEGTKGTWVMTADRGSFFGGGQYTMSVKC